MSAVGSFADLEVKHIGRDLSLPSVAGYPGFTSGGPPGPDTLGGVDGVFPSVAGTTDGGSTTAPGAPTNSTVTYAVAMDLAGKNLEQAKIDFAVDALMMVRVPRDTGRDPTFHQRNQYKTVGRTNRWFEGELQRKTLGSIRDGMQAANEWKMYGTMATPVQEGVVYPDEFTATMRFAKRVRTQDLWCALGSPTKTGQSVFLILVRCKYTSPLEKLQMKEYVQTLEEKDIRARNRVERKRDMQADQQDYAKQLGAAIGIIGGASAAVPSDSAYQWKWVPYRCPRGSEPREDLFIRSSFTGHAKYIGYVTQVFGNGKSDAANKAMAEEALFPSDDTDSYQEPLLGLPQIEIQLRCK